MNVPIFRSRSNLLANKCTRLLVKESHAIFESIQKLPNQSSDVHNPMPRAQMVSLSRRYRCIVHECIENLRSSDCNCKMFKEIEIIWNLCEILMLDVYQTGILITQLINWIKWHQEEPEPKAKAMLHSVDEGKADLAIEENEETYWSLTTKLALRGELKRAVKLLRCHPRYSTSDQFQIVAELLEKMPLSNQYLLHEFCMKWKSWSDLCQRELETGQFNDHPHLLTIMRVLAKDVDVFDEICHLYDNWFQLMVTYLLYNDPCIKETDLSQLCRTSIKIFNKHTNRLSNGHDNYTNGDDTNQQEEINEFDEIIISAFEYDLTQVIRYCCSYLDDNWWFVTHFVDLLHNSDQLKLHDINESSKLREFFLTDYARTLFDDPSLWTVGVVYLDQCATLGLHILEEQLIRVPIRRGQDKKAYKIIAIAASRGLVEITKSISRLMARNWFSSNLKLIDHPSSNYDHVPDENYNFDNIMSSPLDLANAMCWAVDSEDALLATYVADKFLYHYSKTGTFPDEDSLNNLKASMLISDRLAFLAKYYEFRQLMKGKNLASAATLLVSLLVSKISPRFFSSTILLDAQTLLDVRPELLFSSQQILDLMTSLEEISKEHVYSPNSDHEKERCITKEKEKALRMSLALNLARALTISDSSSDSNKLIECSTNEK